MTARIEIDGKLFGVIPSSGGQLHGYENGYEPFKFIYSGEYVSGVPIVTCLGRISSQKIELPSIGSTATIEMSELFPSGTLFDCGRRRTAVLHEVRVTREA